MRYQTFRFRRRYRHIATGIISTTAGIISTTAGITLSSTPTFPPLLHYFRYRRHYSVTNASASAASIAPIAAGTIGSEPSTLFPAASLQILTASGE